MPKRSATAPFVISSSLVSSPERNRLYGLVTPKYAFLRMIEHFLKASGLLTLPSNSRSLSKREARKSAPVCRILASAIDDSITKGEPLASTGRSNDATWRQKNRIASLPFEAET